MKITRVAFDAIVTHARESAPLECCGLLIGGGGRIESAHRAHNSESSPTRFLIDPRDHFAAIRAARAGGHEVVGVYHSHPSTPARPSATDLAEAAYSEYVYAIISLVSDPPDVRAFRFEGGRFVEESMEFITSG